MIEHTVLYSTHLIILQLFSKIVSQHSKEPSIQLSTISVVSLCTTSHSWSKNFHRPKSTLNIYKTSVVQEDRITTIENENAIISLQHHFLAKYDGSSLISFFAASCIRHFSIWTDVFLSLYRPRPDDSHPSPADAEHWCVICHTMKLMRKIMEGKPGVCYHITGSQKNNHPNARFSLYSSILHAPNSGAIAPLRTLHC